MLTENLQKALNIASILTQNASKTLPVLDDPKALMDKISATLDAQT